MTLPVKQNFTFSTLEPMPELQVLTECPYCRETRWEIVPSKGAKPCRCLLAYRRMLALASIPDRFRGVRLATVLPHNAVQARIIANLQANPTRGAFFFGATGEGKTHLAVALLRHAIENDRRARYFPFEALSKQWTEWSQRSEQKPVLRPVFLPEDLDGSEPRTVLFDDIDKGNIKDSSYVGARQMFALMDKVYLSTIPHQLIFTTNDTEEQLKTRWGQPTMRRIAETCDVYAMN